VQPLTDDPTRFLPLKTVFVAGGEKPVKITHCRVDRGNVFLCLENIIGRETAEALRGAPLYIDKVDRVTLPPGRHFIEDLIGADVAGVGTLTEILQYGAADVYRVKTERGMMMFPCIESVVKEIDSRAKRITVDRAELEKVAVYEDEN